MKRNTIIIVAFVLVALLASCSDNPGTTTMRLILATGSESSSRTLSPSDSSLLDVSKYTITGTGPNGKTFTKSSDSDSVTIEGLTIGDWTVTAKGLNSANTEIVSGSLTFRLTATPTPQTIVLDTLIGTGSFRFSIDWSLCDVANPEVEAYLTGPDMKSKEVPLAVTVNPTTKTAVMSESLASGSYLLRVLLFDGNTQVSGLVEAVRISNGTSTEGSHVFHFNELGPNTLMYIKDATGVPIKGSLSVADAPNEFVSETEYTCVFAFGSPETVNSDGLTIDWYYDGLFVQSCSLDNTGSSLAFTPTVGLHRIDAVVYNRKLGSTGSASYSFTTVPNGANGELSLLSDDAASSMTVDSSSMVAALSGDRFVVVSPSAGEIYLCTVSSGALNVVKKYGLSNFEWISDTKHVFSDPTMDYVVFTDDYQGKESISILHFNSTSNTLSNALRMVEWAHEEYGIQFADLSAAAFSSSMNMIFVADAGNEFAYAFEASGGSASLMAFCDKMGAAYHSVCDMDVSPSGSYIVYCAESSTNFVSTTITESGGFVKGALSSTDSFGTQHIRYANPQLVVKAGTGGLSTYKVVAGGAYTKHKTLDIPVLDLEADGGNYIYAVTSGNRIVSFEANGYELTQIGYVTLAAKPVSIALTGGYFAAVTDSGTIALFGIIEK